MSVALTQKKLQEVRNYWQTALTNAACHVQKFLAGRTHCQGGAIWLWAMAMCCRLQASAQHPSAQHRRPSCQWFWLPHARIHSRLPILQASFQTALRSTNHGLSRNIRPFFRPFSKVLAGKTHGQSCAMWRATGYGPVPSINGNLEQ